MSTVGIADHLLLEIPALRAVCLRAERQLPFLALLA